MSSRDGDLFHFFVTSLSTFAPRVADNHTIRSKNGLIACPRCAQTRWPRNKMKVEIPAIQWLVQNPHSISVSQNSPRDSIQALRLENIDPCRKTSVKCHVDITQSSSKNHSLMFISYPRLKPLASMARIKTPVITHTPDSTFTNTTLRSNNVNITPIGFIYTGKSELSRPFASGDGFGQVFCERSCSVVSAKSSPCEWWTPSWYLSMDPRVWSWIHFLFKYGTGELDMLYILF